MAMRAARLISSLILLSYANGANVEVYDGEWTASLKEATGTRYDSNAGYALLLRARVQS